MLDKELLAPLSPWARNEVLRAFADLDNMHKDEREEEVRRLKRSLRYRYDEGINHALKNIVIPVFDDLLRLLDYVEQRRQKRGRVTKDEVRRNIEHPLMSIRGQLYKRLDNYGVQYVCTDADFDPEWMEAVDRRHCKHVHAGFVLERVLPGYRRGKTLLRAAHVVVAAGTNHGEEVPYEA